LGRTSDNFPFKTLNQFKHETPQGMKHAPDTLYEQRRKLSICFKYRDKYMPDHKCNVKGLYMITEKKGRIFRCKGGKHKWWTQVAIIILKNIDCH